MTVGIILAGGHSSRFGSDKALYFDALYKEYWVCLAYQKLAALTDTVFICGNANNQQALKNILPKSAIVLTDCLPFIDCGPLSALYAAASQNQCGTTRQDYLILAVDYPDISQDSLSTLLSKRNCYLQDANQKNHYTVAHLSFCKDDLTYFLTKNKRMKNFLAYLLAIPIFADQNVVNQNTLSK